MTYDKLLQNTNCTELGLFHSFLIPIKIFFLSSYVRAWGKDTVLNLEDPGSKDLPCWFAPKQDIQPLFNTELVFKMVSSAVF